MRKLLIFIAVLFSVETASAEPQNRMQWTPAQVVHLKALINDMPAESLGDCQISSNFPLEDGSAATAAAIQLARTYLDGCLKDLSRAQWHIKSRDHLIDNEKLIALALRRNELGPLYDAYKPQNPHYQALKKALRTETDSQKRARIALNMERWRWMPHYLGETYLIVNVASFEVTLWENHRKIRSWPVIVGKTETPTPVFDAKVSGVIFNPWWEIPSSIVAEGIGAMVRNRPATARRKGYVLQNGRYRQQPGPGNALGLMKLIMPNAHSVYLHDTPNKKLFANDVRTYSHGCVRVDDAIGFAKTLLANDHSGEEVDEILNAGHTKALNMAESIPIYIAYFTVEGTDDASLIFHPDIYRRDTLVFKKH
ncbi:L,D-transpeptidase family protein [Sphingorhabdus sp. EL138]|uniref:L,D-transpeptidase family protein n=1 Tax=Sphingorhabdus sp. EL138 TaxID=2073156 RepID=UPI000D696D1E|nr:L,D-transpeptidase family protein [Sphingorhabdus sp. EL138]